VAVAAASKAGDEGAEAKLAKGVTTEAWEQKGGGDDGGRRKCGALEVFGRAPPAAALAAAASMGPTMDYGLGNGTGAGGCEREGSAHRHTQYMST